MKWEDLKVYRVLNKEDLKLAKKEIENLVAERLLPFGFKKYGRKLIRRSDDLFHIIHLDSRGSWMGASTSLQTEIQIVSIYDVDVMVKGYETGPKTYIQDIIPKIKNYYQITQEYELFAEFISENLIQYVIPYFNQFSNSKDVLRKTSKLRLKNQYNFHLILYSELSNHIKELSMQILEYKIRRAHNDDIKVYSNLKSLVEENKWNDIDQYLERNKDLVFKKLKIK